MGHFWVILWVSGILGQDVGSRMVKNMVKDILINNEGCWTMGQGYTDGYGDEIMTDDDAWWRMLKDMMKDMETEWWRMLKDAQRYIEEIIKDVEGMAEEKRRPTRGEIGLSFVLRSRLIICKATTYSIGDMQNRKGQPVCFASRNARESLWFGINDMQERMLPVVTWIR